MVLSPLDWLVVLVYAAFAVGVGLVYARRAGRSPEDYFLSGRTLPWWVAGTSMIATSFAADTPLLVSGWVREAGIWKNWVWWCFAVSQTVQVFLFARWWRRGDVMTKAELTELRYGGRGARVLRGALGLLHASVTNTLVLCWVLLAAAKISEVLFGVDKLVGLSVACAIALSYSLSAGFWGVVVTDVVQFVIAAVGGVALAVVSWQAIGGGAGLEEAVASGVLDPERLAFLPTAGDGPWWGGAFWTASAAAVAVHLGVAWWAVENVDGSGISVQRIAASKDERHGALALLWFNVGHYALRPWIWIPVGLASLLLLPALEVRAPVDGAIVGVEARSIELAAEGGAGTVHLSLAADGDDWDALPLVAAGETVTAGQALARTDPERAYVVMMARYLPVGLLGLVAASLLAAFMSTIDTHVNLASSFFVNDVYRRFVRKDAGPRHHVLVARIASAAVLALAALLAWQADSVRSLFLFFLAFLGGVGPIYLLRWLWWRVGVAAELAAMSASALTATACTLWPGAVALGPLSPDGELSPEGRLVVVALVSLAASLVAIVLAPRPDPAQLVAFYRRVRPAGRWGPVRALAPDAAPPREVPVALAGTAGALALTYGLLIGIGAVLLGRGLLATVALATALAGAVLTARALRRLLGAPPASTEVPSP